MHTPQIMSLEGCVARAHRAVYDLHVRSQELDLYNLSTDTYELLMWLQEYQEKLVQRRGAQMVPEPPRLWSALLPF